MHCICATGLYIICQRKLISCIKKGNRMYLKCLFNSHRYMELSDAAGRYASRNSSMSCSKTWGSSLRFGIALLATLGICGLSASNAISDAGIAPPPPMQLRVHKTNLDSDGVQMLYPSAPGSSFQLSRRDPNATARFVIEKGTQATVGVDGAIRYWNLPSYALNYSSGGSGWTSRLHIYAGGGTQQYTWKTQHGYLSGPADVKNQELTVFVRVHQILDAPRAQITLKIRGGAHSSSDPDRASCVMLTYSPSSHGSVTRFGKELTHPDYDYITLAPAFSAPLVENVWVGLKMVSWNDPRDPTRVINRLYIDTDPFMPGTGRPGNNWRLFSEYVDIEGKSTGQYTKLADWGGWVTTIRTDGFHDIDFAFPSVREIVAPR
jgi:hypothetical protein